MIDDRQYLSDDSLRAPSRPDGLVPSPNEDSYHPVLIRADTDEGRRRLEELAASGRVRTVHDTIDDQLDELIQCREPSAGHSPRSLAAARAAQFGAVPSWLYGSWVFYPWSSRLVHLLPRDEFRLVRTDRNRNKISRAEQAGLLGRRVGVIGLSVGNSAAVTLAMEGIGGAFRLADFDRVGLSNLNRLRTGVAELGAHKAILAARQMFEIDPYLDIEIHPDGLTEQGLPSFFDGPGGNEPLDLLVEECDGAWAKVAAREQARARRIPVLMDANDRGLLDVERFDLEPDRPLFHGRAGEVSAEQVRELSGPALIALLLQIVDESRISPALREAMGEIGHSLSSWPQLASGVMLGGALVADTARRILLGQPVPSGRSYIDLDTLIPAAIPAASVLEQALEPVLEQALEQVLEPAAKQESGVA